MASPPPDRDVGSILSARRAAIAVGVGLLAGAVVALAGDPELLPIVAWIVATTIVMAWVWRIVWPQDAAGTERLAEAESHSRTTDTAVVVAAIFSLGTVALALVHYANQPGATVSVLLSVVSVILSWALVNTVFALKYARLYYLELDDGGIDFKQREPPAYSDFAYVAFTVGMAFAVSDTEPTSPRTRKIALGHALLSYALGTGILAVAINLVSNIGQG
jgi:uncharacterized membrane protein